MVTAVVFSGGPVEGRHPAEDVLSTLDAELAVAVDSGLELAQHLGWHVDLVVGDMDSVAPGALDRAESDGATVRRHPVAKDATDLELALEEAAAAGAGRVVVVGSPAGRMDHLLGAAATLASPRWDALAVDAWFGATALHVVRRRRTLQGAPGALVSLLPVNGAAHGVRTAGLRFPLRDETLEAGSSRGVSNEFVTAAAEVEVRDGALLAVLPDAAAVLSAPRALAGGVA